MQRDMSYELDDAFSTRNDGEVLLVDAQPSRVLRGGGSLNISRPNAVARDAAGATAAAMGDGFGSAITVIVPPLASNSRLPAGHG